jgi:transcriptional regulator with XRE-family HTH domain
MSLAQVAEKVDTGVKHLGRVERGERQASFELIIALAHAMNVSPSVFFDFESAQADPRVLKEQLRQLLQRQDGQQLLKTYRVLKLILEP